MSAERLTKLGEMAVDYQHIAGSFGSLSQTDIAAACIGMPEWLYDLLILKYVKTEGPKHLELLIRVSQRLIDQNKHKSETIKAVAAFVSYGHCERCNGRGVVIWADRQVKPCQVCGGTGKASPKDHKGLTGAILQGIVEWEMRALENFRKQLA